MVDDTYPRRALSAETKYRGMSSGGWIDKEQDPWGVTIKAFLRKSRDTDGITVLPRAHLCCALDIRGIGQIGVGGIETLQNPVDREALHVEEDTPNHGYIVNVPYHGQFPKEANDLATDLAELCCLLGNDEYENARERWAATDVAANEGASPT